MFTTPGAEHKTPPWWSARIISFDGDRRKQRDSTHRRFAHIPASVSPESNPIAVLEALSPKEKEALALVAQQFTNKEIARRLNISNRAVEERLKTARYKLGADDRRSAARRYSALIGHCDKTTGGPSTVDERSEFDQQSTLETAVEVDLTVGAFERSEPSPRTAGTTFLEGYDLKFGRIGRVYAVVGLAVLMGLLLIAGVAIAVVARLLI